MKCAIISYDNSSLPEVTNGIIHLSKSGDVMQIYESMLRISNDPQYKSIIQKQAYENSFHFNWKKTAAKTYELYIELLEKRTSPNY